MTQRVLFFALAAGSLVPFVPTWVALVAGIGFGLFVVHPFPAQTKQAATYLLQGSVVGLGAAMNLEVVLRVGASGIGQTLAAIVITLGASVGLAKLLGTERITSLLIGVGTAICGGSAIAAVAPVIGAKSHQTSVSLAVVFLLNALALVIFPPIGHLVGLEPAPFGLWSALAIHDTSSVVGASMQFGETALQVGTTVKLARALWIVPLTLVLARVVKSEDGAKSAKKPWFILGFLAMAALVTWVPGLAEPGQLIARVARQVLVLTLFLIGTGVNREALKAVGLKPLLLGVILWAAVGGTTLWLISRGLLTT